MKLQIRQARAADLPDVLALQADSLRRLSVGYYAANKIESLVRTQASARSQHFKTGVELLYIGELADGKSVRMVAIATLMTERSQIGAVYVHPDFARQGISRQLLRIKDLIRCAIPEPSSLTLLPRGEGDQI